MTTTNMIRLNAGNDRNGNPRRVYVGLTASGAVTGAWDEGYAGFRCVPCVMGGVDMEALARSAPTFATTPAEYHSLLRSTVRVLQ